MSVINQMLNGLEQRGVHLEAEQVRPVQVVIKERALFILPVAALAIVLLVKYLMPVVMTVVIPAAKVAAPAAKPQPVELAAVKVAVLTKADLPVVALPVKKSDMPSEDVADHPVRKKLLRHYTVQLVSAKELKPPADQPVKQMAQDDAFRQSQDLQQQGKKQQAREGFENVLQQHPQNQAARSALVDLLLEDKQNTEAELVLRDGLRLKPAHTGFAMLLARLQIQRDDLEAALATLEAGLPHASAEYQAFYAALLQRKGRYQESAEYYQLALNSVPHSGIWQMGYGISLQALSKKSEAKQAYQQALDSQTLSTGLQAFVLQKLKEL